MASEDNLLNKIAALVAGFDDAAWEALASKGLLRRARKDIEKGLPINVVEQTKEELKIEVSPFFVSLTVSGPAGAGCSCPAPGICQHILAAGLYLQTLSSETQEERAIATESSIRDEMVLLTTETLKSWVGSADFKNGVALLERNALPTVIEYTETVLVRLMPSGIEVRFVPGGGLDGMILPKTQGKRAGVAAILALRKSLGFEIPVTAAQKSLVELGGTPRTRKEILDSACAVMEDALTVGLTHLSEVFVDRLVTLSVSAQGAQMPRVSLALKTVSDEVTSILRRDARADESRLLVLMSRVYALMDAIREGGDNRAAELSGTFRGQYIEVPEIELSGVGAYPWQTGSGYTGLTVLFWTNQTKEFLSWSYARPEIEPSDARQRFYGEGPWEGAQSPQQVAGSSLKLRNARRTINGRLSGSTKTTALVIAPVAPQELEFGDRLFTSWEILRRYVAGKQPVGLRDPNPLDLIVLLQPVEFGPRAFDSITQTFTWEVFDAIGQALTLTLPFRDWTKESIRTLEQLSPLAGVSWKFVVKLASESNQLLVEPISILRGESRDKPVFHLAFDSVPPPGVGERANVTEIVPENSGNLEQGQLEEDYEVVDLELPVGGSFNKVISELNRRLEAIAEAGIQSALRIHLDWFERSSQEIHSLGLTALANAVDSLNKRSSTPRKVFEARYLSYLHVQSIARLT